MNFLKQFATSETGQKLISTVGQQLTETIRENVDKRMNNMDTSAPTALSTASTSESASSTSPPEKDGKDSLINLITRSPSDIAELKWPRRVTEKECQVHTVVSSIFAFANYDGGQALLHRPTCMVVYYDIDIAGIQKLQHIYKTFNDEIETHTDPLSVIHDLILLILNDYEQKLECKPVYFAIYGSFHKFVNDTRRASGSNFLTTPIAKNGDTFLHVAARAGNVDMMAEFWNDHLDMYKANKNGETFWQCAMKKGVSWSNNKMMMFISERISEETRSELNYLKALTVKSITFYETLEVLREKYVRKTVLPRLDALALGRILAEGAVSPSDLKEVLTMLTTQNPMLMAEEVTEKGENIFHCLHNLPDKYHSILVKFATDEMIIAQRRDGQTPLHVNAGKGALSAFVTLWAHDAQLHLTDFNALFPMDIALLNDQLDILKACFVFDAPAKPETLKLVVGSQTEYQRVKELVMDHYSIYFEKEGRTVHYDPNIPTHRRCQNFPNIKETDQVVLCLDGGGMKGVLALQVLKELENIKQLSLVSWFNHISGTSTGSIIALGLVKYSNVDDVLRAYFRLKDDVFVGTRPYSGDGLEKALAKEFGDVTLDQLGKGKNVKISIPVARVDVSPPALCMFRNYQFKNDLENDQPAWPASKIARASSAAPSFFSPVDQKYMDGGLISNNPTIDVLADCQRLAFDAEDCTMSKIMVSIGTGSITKSCQNIDLVKPTSVAGLVQAFSQIVHLKDVLIDQITASDGVTVERAKWMAEAMGMAYFRFSPTLDTPVAIDETDNLTLIENMLSVKYNTVLMRNEMHMLAQILK